MLLGISLERNIKILMGRAEGAPNSKCQRALTNDQRSLKKYLQPKLP